MDTQIGDRSGDFSSEEPEFVESDPEELCYRLHAVNVLDRAWRAWRAVVASTSDIPLQMSICNGISEVEVE